MPHGLLSCLRFIPKRCAVKIPGTWRLAFQDLPELQISHLWNGRTDISSIYLKSSNRNLWKNTLKNIKCFTNVGVLLLVLPGSLLSSVLRSESLKIQVAKDNQNPLNMQLFMNWLITYKFRSCSNTDPNSPKSTNAKWLVGATTIW